MSYKGDPDPAPVACNLGAMSPEQRTRHRSILTQLRTALHDVVEQPDGYSFRYPARPELFMALAEFITLESLCCSFFRFVLEKGPAEGDVWLRVSGPEGTGIIIKSALGG